MAVKEAALSPEGGFLFKPGSTDPRGESSVDSG
jgi:hypothetical protein